MILSKEKNIILEPVNVAESFHMYNSYLLLIFGSA